MNTFNWCIPSEIKTGDQAKDYAINCIEKIIEKCECNEVEVICSFIQEQIKNCPYVFSDKIIEYCERQLLILTTKIN